MFENEVIKDVYYVRVNYGYFLILLFLSWM